MERRDLILQEDLPKRPEILDEGKLVSLVDEAAALAAMKETRGFKILYTKFIEPRTTKERIFSARGPFRRAEEVAAVKELDLLMKFIDGSIEKGQEANTKLEALRKPKGR
jgi:hypothetical protein